MTIGSNDSSRDPNGLISSNPRRLGSTSSSKKVSYSIEERPVIEGEYDDLTSEACASEITGNEQDYDEDEDDNDPLRYEFRSLPPNKRPSPFFAIIGLFLIILGQAISTTSQIDAIILLICRHHFPDRANSTSSSTLADPRCHQSEIAAAVATFAAYRGVISGIIGSIVSPRVCAYSDRIGRRPLLIYVGVAIGLADLIMVLCSKYPTIMDYKWILVSAVLTGFSGTTLVGCLYSSYFADCIRPTVRPKYFAWAEASVNSGLALGPGIGSMVLLKFNSVSLVLSITFLVSLAYTFTVYFFVPESRTIKARRQSQTAYTTEIMERRQRHLERETSWSEQYLDAINIFRPLAQLSFPHLTSKRDVHNAWLLVIIVTVPSGLGVGLSQLFVMYPELVFKWTSVQTGYLLSMMGTIKSCSLALIFPSFYRILEYFWNARVDKLDRIDTLLIRIGITGYTIGYCGLALARSGSVFTAGIASADFFVGIWAPALKNGIVKYASKDDVGEVFGALGMLIQISSIFCPFVFLTVFNKTLTTRPQLVFEMAAITLVSLSVLTYVLKTGRTKVNKHHHHHNRRDRIVDDFLQPDETDSLLQRGANNYQA